MSEENKPMVTISADEYFNLRQRAESANYIQNSLDEMRTRVVDLNAKVWELDRKIYSMEVKQNE